MFWVIVIVPCSDHKEREKQKKEIMLKPDRAITKQKKGSVNIGKTYLLDCHISITRRCWSTFYILDLTALSHRQIQLGFTSNKFLLQTI